MTPTAYGGAEMTEPRRPRISIDVTAELRRRIRLAAAAQDMSVTQYCRRVIEERVALDGDDEDSARARQERARATVAGLREMQRRIFGQHRLPTDSAELIHEAREGRLAELP